MSFRCVIMLRRDALWGNQGQIQTSPLRFATRDEATAFGRVMFEPPQSLELWKIEFVEESANYDYKKGELRPL